ncbi:MAG: hypothetical protein D8M59_11305 [Planctomycetes bacterium]|nr:hypothetical protein [Planctomycetota bacterium]
MLRSGLRHAIQETDAPEWTTNREQVSIMPGHDFAVTTRPLDGRHSEASADRRECQPVPDPFPAWLAATILVGLSGVFWVGILTIAQWLWSLGHTVAALG